MCCTCQHACEIRCTARRQDQIVSSPPDINLSVDQISFALTKIDLRSGIAFVKNVLQPTLQIRPASNHRWNQITTAPSWDAQHTTRQLMAVYEYLSRSTATMRSKCHPVVLALMSARLSAPVHIRHKPCVSSQMIQCLMSWNLHQISPSTDHVLSIHTCACAGVMHI